MKKLLPIGIDSFREIRETDRYYVDKTLVIRDFFEFGDKVALITRPRRFGKTLNMTTVMEFFDVTADSKGLFEGLAIMGTEYSDLINSRPVLFFSFKDCKARTAESLLFQIADVVATEYTKYSKVFEGQIDLSNDIFCSFSLIHKKLRHRDINVDFLAISIKELMRAVCEHYKTKPIVLIDEYDQPILSSVEHGYHDELKDFFSGFYGGALKGQASLHQALLTGIQRVAKESIFSQLNNVKVYTVCDTRYSQHFGLTKGEAGELLSHFGLGLGDAVKMKYDGYIFGKEEMYNPWSILYYAETGALENYWVNTSTNFLIRKSISEAGSMFREGFDKLVAEGAWEIDTDLTCSFIELANDDTLWGLLINSGYLTVVSREVGSTAMTVRIPNGEVRFEFLKIIAGWSGVGSKQLDKMFRFLLARDLEGFMRIYQEIVLTCTSFAGAKENAYHMLFLGMCITLTGLYRITSNIEAGHGRSDIRMESLSAARPHIVIEFKQGEDIDGLKDAALAQIMENRYYAGLSGECLCIGIAHDKKRCAAAHQLMHCGG
ncbi:MAG: ATP-binding protein [Clostridiales bacterium]|nr:ATP-binding protein [Clostridiales bacterium]